MPTGVIGTGHLGFHHTRILGEITGKPVPIYDASIDRMKELESKLNAVPCGSLDELLDICDSAVVAATTSAHHGIVMKALENDLDVLVEKPIAATLDEAEEMVRLAAGKELVLAVGHVERFNPAILAAAELIDSPLFVEGHRMAPFNPRGTDVSVVLDLMIHDIDLVLSFVRSGVESVQASGVPVLSGNVDIASARIKFDNSCVVNMTASRISREQIRKLRFFQPRKYVSVDFAKRSVDAYRLSGQNIEPVSVKVGDGDALTLELEDFLSACLRRTEPTVPGREGLMALRSARIISEKIMEAYREIERNLRPE